MDKNKKIFTKRLKIEILIVAFYQLALILLKIHPLSYFLAPFLIIFSWSTIKGPNFTRLHRHPEINDILNLPITKKLLHRDFLKPKKMNIFLIFFLILILIAPGIIFAYLFRVEGVSLFLNIFHYIWWIMFTVVCLLATTPVLEELIKICIAHWLTGGLVVLFLFITPIGLFGFNFYSVIFVLAAILLSLDSLYSVTLLRFMNEKNLLKN